MSTFFNDIRIALEANLVNISGISNIIYENVEVDLDDFEKSNTVEFIHAFNVPSSTTTLSMGTNGQDIHEGVFQINYFSQVGRGGFTTKLDAIADAYKRGTSLTSNSTEVTVRNVSLGVGRREDAYFVRNVDVSYYAVTSARS